MKKTIAFTAIILLLISSCSRQDETYVSMSVLSTTGTVDIERSSQTLTAREGMRLINQDVVLTAAASTAWLTLDEFKAAQLAELTRLRVDRQPAGFKLALLAGEITSQIDKPLDDDDSFTVTAANLVFGVRGTVFTVRNEGNVVTLSVETGVVEVTDLSGNIVAVLSDGETAQFHAETGALITGGATGNEQEPPLFTWAPGTAEATDLPDGFNSYHYKAEGSIHEFFFEGYWTDGLPNGTGTLTRTGSVTTPTSVYEGSFVDGFAHGEFTITHVSEDGTSTSWTFDVDMGYPTEDHTVNAQGQTIQHNLDARYGLTGVPPWAFIG